MLFQNISKKKLKNIRFPLERKKIRPPRLLAQLSIWKAWTRYFRHRHLIQPSTIITDSEVIKSYQCSLLRSHAVSIELNSEF